MTSPPPFELRSSFTPRALVVTVSGEVDTSSSGHVADAVASASGGRELVVVDLTDVTFVDSSTLNALVRSQRLLAERGITLRLIVPLGGIVRRVFEIASLIEPLNVVETQEEAFG
jgi:anti-anti-sigma factor